MLESSKLAPAASTIAAVVFRLRLRGGIARGSGGIPRAERGGADRRMPQRHRERRDGGEDADDDHNHTVADLLTHMSFASAPCRNTPCVGGDGLENQMPGRRKRRAVRSFDYPTTYLMSRSVVRARPAALLYRSAKIPRDARESRHAVRPKTTWVPLEPDRVAGVPGRVPEQRTAGSLAPPKRLHGTFEFLHGG